MRLNIFDRFLFLVHRRTKSDPLAFNTTIRPEILPTSHSLDFSLGQQHARFTSSPTKLRDLQPLPVNARLPTPADRHSCSMEPPLLEPLGLTMANPPNRHIQNLDEYSKDVTTFPEHSGVISAQLMAVRETLYDTRDRLRSAYPVRDHNCHILLLLEDYFHLIENLGLDESLLRDGELAADSDFIRNANDLVVEAIKDAAELPDSDWRRIIQAVIGQEAPARYISAIDSTVRTRRHLRSSRKSALFWKKTAKLDTKNNEVVTPSSSAISGILREQVQNLSLDPASGAAGRSDDKDSKQPSKRCDSPDSSLLPYLRSSSSISLGLREDISAQNKDVTSRTPVEAVESYSVPASSLIVGTSSQVSTHFLDSTARSLEASPLPTQQRVDVTAHHIPSSGVTDSSQNSRTKRPADQASATQTNHIQTPPKKSRLPTVKNAQSSDGPKSPHNSSHRAIWSPTISSALKKAPSTKKAPIVPPLKLTSPLKSRRQIRALMG